ncbi:MAG TPA: cupredoxin domain-containing protein, partial [Gemmatimonadales bacterium]|nr:cupredoxin domain-containing protein [Gemmatimonadales bacterium]
AAGLALIAAIYWWFFRAGRRAVIATTTAGGVQEILVTVAGGYAPGTIALTTGRPARLVFDRRETNPCSEEVVIPAFGVRKFLAPHERTAVEFTPPSPGTFDMSCGMGMLHGKIVVTN